LTGTCISASSGLPLTGAISLVYELSEVFEQFDAKNVDQDLQKCLLAYRNKGPKRDISPEIKARRDSTSFGWPAT